MNDAIIFRRDKIKLAAEHSLGNIYLRSYSTPSVGSVVSGLPLEMNMAILEAGTSSEYSHGLGFCPGGFSFTSQVEEHTRFLSPYRHMLNVMSKEISWIWVKTNIQTGMSQV
jgi:hypothetical protein